METKKIGPFDPGRTAIVTIDIQMDYFRGGAFPLWRSGRALGRARAVLDWGRAGGFPIFHVQHFSKRPGAWFLVDGTPGTALHPGLGIRPDEPVVAKAHPNSFRETALGGSLRERGIQTVVWLGMISWMCVDTTVRAAYDEGFANVLVADATASGPLPKRTGLPGFVPPWRAQSAFVSALGVAHATIVDAAWLTATAPA